MGHCSLGAHKCWVIHIESDCIQNDGMLLIDKHLLKWCMNNNITILCPKFIKNEKCTYCTSPPILGIVPCRCTGCNG